MNKLKPLSWILIPFSFFFLAFSFPDSGDDVIGEWYTDGNESVIKIYKKGDVYYGNIHWVAQPYEEDGTFKRDVLNPDKSKRNQLITEVVLLNHFKFDGEDTWEDGIIYNPEDGKDYHGRITLKDRNTLFLRGYIGAPIFGRTVTWIRK